MPAGPVSFETILLLHGITNATIDITFASGPAAAATNGMAVEAIHQDCGSSSSAGLMRNEAQKRSHTDVLPGPSGVERAGGATCSMVHSARAWAGISAVPKVPEAAL